MGSTRRGEIPEGSGEAGQHLGPEHAAEFGHHVGRGHVTARS